MSLSATVLDGALSTKLQIARFQRPDGRVVVPDHRSVGACASTDVYNAALNTFRLQFSQDAACYPLAEPVHIAVETPDCGPSMSLATVEFMAWLLSNPIVARTLSYWQMAPLYNVSEAVNTHNQAVLSRLSCTPATHSTALVAAGIASTSLGALILALAAVVAWKSTARLRALRAQFSDSNVAHQCCEAIAVMDLERVAWLKDVSKPNRIQGAFLRILTIIEQVVGALPWLQAGGGSPHPLPALQPAFRVSSGR